MSAPDQALKAAVERNEALLQGLAARLERQSSGPAETLVGEAMAFLMREEAKALRTLLAALSSQASVMEEMAEPIARFVEALAVEPAIAERVALGQQFNAYDLTDDDGGAKALCLGPITSRPISLCEAPASVADLLECALRVAMKARTLGDRHDD